MTQPFLRNQRGRDFIHLVQCQIADVGKGGTALGFHGQSRLDHAKHRVVDHRHPAMQPIIQKPAPAFRLLGGDHLAQGIGIDKAVHAMQQRQHRQGVRRFRPQPPVTLHEQPIKHGVDDAAWAGPPSYRLQDFSAVGQLVEPYRLDAAGSPHQVNGVPLVVEVKAFGAGYDALQALDAVDQFELDGKAKIGLRLLADRHRDQFAAADDPQFRGGGGHVRTS